jgi:hypothetical protein
MFVAHLWDTYPYHIYSVEYQEEHDKAPPSGQTRRAYRCQDCQEILFVLSQFGTTPKETYPCVFCRHGRMQRYFGNMSGRDVAINYGFRENRYSNERDSNIAKFQFQNL